ncbi:MAG: putative Type I phosphodiesterase/nucleotide pyrophosphatase/phosphate transferase [Promethearchaeota archaeon]|nr:MAG: putative Type I phosphodiesterase/nucleotide pyrophosphatase/phosphate transferase [Candidatus Lokiarchaeota archaeon]
MSNFKQNFILIGVDQALGYLLKKFIKEKKIPSIEKLYNNGVFCEGLSCPPCDTPTNWASIATGAPTSAHGATSFYMHIPGEPLDLGLTQRSRTQLSRYGNAEYIWDVADRKGRTPFVLNYPAGWPSDFKNGAMSLLVWPIPESLPRIIGPSGKFRYSKNSGDNSRTLIEIRSDEIPFESSSPPLKFSLEFKHGKIEEKKDITGFLIDSNGNGYDSLIFNAENDEWIKLGKAEEKKWLQITLNTEYGELLSLVKFELSEIHPEGEYVEFKRSSIYNTEGWARPESLGKDIIKNVISKDLSGEEREVEYMISGDVDSYLIYARREAISLAETVVYAKKKIHWDTCFFHVHLLDSVNHKELALLHEDSSIYSVDTEEKAWENVETAYKIIDEMVEILFNHVIDEKTNVIFTADHGAIPAWKIVNIPLALMEAGLLTYKWKTSKKSFVVDWKKSKVFPYLEPPYIWINLQGRDPNGIVKCSEYEAVRNQVIQILYSLRDPETNERIVKLALKKEEAAFFGQNGERIGDVVFFLEPPYQIFDGKLHQLNTGERTPESISKPLVYDAESCFGAHAYYLPTQKLGNFSVSAPVIMSGPSFKEGIELSHHINLMDLTPTISHILNIDIPKHSQGRLIHEALK